MLSGRDYLREVKKFTTSQYWNTGVRITAGVMLPTIVLEHFGWLSIGMPFLWGALFVSITDTPGPIHHRRNGLLAAVAFNTVTVLITSAARDYQEILIVEIIVLTFFYSLFGIFGNRAGAIGVLALVIMLLNLVPHSAHVNAGIDALLIFGGGLWYTAFSLMLYRIRPYRLAEQAIGENLIAIASYLKARATLYKPGNSIENAFNDVMGEQIHVLKCQETAGEILFKTRQFVADASPKSRSMMMIFIESNDLLEQVMSAHQNYRKVHATLEHTGLLNKFHDMILMSAAELERIGLIIQSGDAIRDDVKLAGQVNEITGLIAKAKEEAVYPEEVVSLDALNNSLTSLMHIVDLMQRLVQYSRLEIKNITTYDEVVEANRMVVTQPIEWKAIGENLTFKSNTFRYAVRLTAAVLIGYVVSNVFSLSHSYWVLLTIVTILKPVYAISRKRNIQRLGGTLIGALLASVAISYIVDRTVLLGLMIFTMVMSYSLLRVNYFGFVVFLTIYIIISFHFLNPAEFSTLIEQRIIDTAVGSVIAALAARFILPVWGLEEIDNSLKDMLVALDKYFNVALTVIGKEEESKEFNKARKDAVVALTNLSDNFQRVLSEPKKPEHAEQIHQFVIAAHILTGHIASLSRMKIPFDSTKNSESTKLIGLIHSELQEGANPSQAEVKSAPSANSVGPLGIIYTFAREIRGIFNKMHKPV